MSFFVGVGQTQFAPLSPKGSGPKLDFYIMDGDLAIPILGMNHLTRQVGVFSIAVNSVAPGGQPGKEITPAVPETLVEVIKKLSDNGNGIADHSGITDFQVVYSLETRFEKAIAVLVFNTGLFTAFFTNFLSRWFHDLI
jgi:hypothetical protein